jgi:hypothetical protein
MEIELNEEKLLEALEPDGFKESSKLNSAMGFLEYLEIHKLLKNKDGDNVLISREAVNDLFNIYESFKNQYQLNPTPPAPKISTIGKGIVDLYDHLRLESDSQISTPDATELRNLFDYTANLKKNLSVSDLPIGRLNSFGSANFLGYEEFKDKRTPQSPQYSFHRSDSMSSKTTSTFSDDDDTHSHSEEYERLDNTELPEKDKRPMSYEPRDESTLFRTYSVGEDTGRTNKLIVKHANEFVDRMEKKLYGYYDQALGLDAKMSDGNQSPYQKNDRIAKLEKLQKKIQRYEKRVDNHTKQMEAIIKLRNGGLNLENNATLKQAMGRAIGRSLKNGGRFVASNSYQLVGRRVKKLKTPAKYLGIIITLPITVPVVLAASVAAGAGIAVQGTAYVAARVSAGILRGVQKGYHKTLNFMGRKDGLTLLESWKAPFGRVALKLFGASKEDIDKALKITNAKLEQKQIKRIASLLGRVRDAKAKQAKVNHREEGFREVVNEIKNPIEKALTKFYSPERFGILKERLVTDKPSNVKGFYKASTALRDAIKDKSIPVDKINLPDKPVFQAAWIGEWKAGRPVTGFEPERPDFEALATSLVRDWGAKKENKLRSRKGNNLTGGAQVHDAINGETLRTGEVLFVDPKTEDAYVLEHPRSDKGELLSKVFGQVKVLTKEQQKDMGLENLKSKDTIPSMEIGTENRVDPNQSELSSPPKARKFQP